MCIQKALLKFHQTYWPSAFHQGAAFHEALPWSPTLSAKKLWERHHVAIGQKENCLGALFLCIFPFTNTPIGVFGVTFFDPKPCEQTVLSDSHLALNALQQDFHVIMPFGGIKMFKVFALNAYLSGMSLCSQTVFHCLQTNHFQPLQRHGSGGSGKVLEKRFQKQTERRGKQCRAISKIMAKKKRSGNEPNLQTSKFFIFHIALYLQYPSSAKPRQIPGHQSSIRRIPRTSPPVTLSTLRKRTCCDWQSKRVLSCL